MESLVFSDNLGDRASLFTNERKLLRDMQLEQRKSKNISLICHKTWPTFFWIHTEPCPLMN